MSVIDPVNWSAVNRNLSKSAGQAPPSFAAYWFHPMSKLHQAVEALPGIHFLWGRVSPDPLPVSAYKAGLV